MIYNSSIVLFSRRGDIPTFSFLLLLMNLKNHFESLLLLDATDELMKLLCAFLHVFLDLAAPSLNRNQSTSKPACSSCFVIKTLFCSDRFSAFSIKPRLTVKR